MDIEQYIQELDQNEDKKRIIHDHILKAKKEQEFFISIFPKTEIRNIGVLDYVPGKTIDGNVDRETFAYLIEFGSKNFGGVGGGSAKKFAVYMSKEKQELVYPEEFSSPDEAYDYTINLIADCIDHAENFIKTKDWKKFSDKITELIESVNGTPSIPIISKIIAMYYPDEFIRIWSHQWLNKALDTFQVKRNDLPEGGIEGKFYEKMQRLMEIKISHPIMKKWSNEYFSYAIGEYLSPKEKSDKTESSLLKFIQNDMKLQANYQPIVLKTLLEAGDKNHFSVSLDEIKEKIKLLNLNRSFNMNDAITAVSGALSKYVTFGDTVSLHLDSFSSSEIPKGLKICGQKISKWHLEHFMKEKNNFYFIQAGEENQYLDEFKATKSVGVSYREFGSFDLSNLNKKEILEKTNGKFGTELDNISKIQLGDIILVTEGRTNGITEFGIVTKEYFFQEQSETYKHRVNVEFLNFGNENINRGAGKAILRVEDAKKISEIRIALGEESGNYYIITQNPGSKYDDIEGEQYAFDSDKSHYKKFIKNTNFIVQTKIDGQYYFTGYGKVGYLEKTNSIKENGRGLTHIIAKFSKYKKFKEQKVRTDKINQKMLKIAFPNTGSNPQPPAMLEIPKVLYQQIIGEDLTSEDDEIDAMTEHSQTIEILKRKKNIILYGPPGTGKTFTAKKIAKQMNGATKSVTFHQSYGYEEFIEGIRPQSTGNAISYPVKPGVFKKFCQSLPIMNWRQAAIYVLNEKEASLHYKEITRISIELEISPKDTWQFTSGYPRKTPWLSQLREMTEDIRINNENSIFKKSLDDDGKEIPGTYELNKKSPNYENEIMELDSLKNNDLETPKIFIIDEINRGNISKIFGELITIIENDKRGTEVTLAYSGEQFSVPPNVYIIGTMNTADQSLTHIDAALKRRFSSIEVMPKSSILKKGMKGLPELLDKINEKVREKISRDNQIGHSYFMQDGKPITEIKELQFVFATDIIPLLRDYFYDSDDDLKEVLGEQFIDWNEGSNRNVIEDWQNNSETFRTAIKEAYNVTI